MTDARGNVDSRAGIDTGRAGSLQMYESTRKRKSMEPDDKTLPPDGSIDAGLIVLGIVKPRGASYTQEEIAIACGCSRGYIWLLEKTAMEKMRKRFQRLREEGRISEEWFE